MTTDTPPPEPGRTAPRRSRPVPLVVGVLLALVGLPLLLAGLGLGWATATQRDDDGFFSTPTERLATGTVALTSEVVDLGEAGSDEWGRRRPRHRAAERPVRGRLGRLRRDRAERRRRGLPGQRVVRRDQRPAHRPLRLLADPARHRRRPGRCACGPGVLDRAGQRPRHPDADLGPRARRLHRRGHEPRRLPGGRGRPVRGRALRLARTAGLEPRPAGRRPDRRRRAARGARRPAAGAAGPPPGRARSGSGSRPARHPGDAGRRAGPAAEPLALAGQVVPGDPALRRARGAVAGLRGAHRGGVLRDPGHRPLPARPVRPQRRHPAVELAGAVLRDGRPRHRPLPAVHPRPRRLPGRPRHRLPRAALARARAGQVGCWRCRT